MSLQGAKSESYFLKTLSGLHTGCGENDTNIDQPVERESITGYPKLESTAIKGMLMSQSKETKQEFERNQHIALTDFKLLYMPVHTTPGFFKYATCPHILERFFSDLISHKQEEEEAKLLLDEISMINEECVYQFKKKEEMIHIGNSVFDVKYFNSVPKCLDNIKDKLLILDNENFKWISREMTEQVKRNKLDENGKSLNLFSKEYVPESSVFYGFVVKFPDVKKNIKMSENIINTKTHYYLGGDRALGKGKILFEKEVI